MAYIPLISIIGDVTFSVGGVATIAAGAVTLAKMATVANNTVLGNTSGGAAAPSALTALAGLTAYGIRDTSATYDVQLSATSSVALTGNQALTFDVTNAARTIQLTGNAVLNQDVSTAGNPAFKGVVINSPGGVSGIYTKFFGNGGRPFGWGDTTIICAATFTGIGDPWLQSLNDVPFHMGYNYDALEISSSGIVLRDSLTTGAPTGGTAAAWKLGSYVSGYAQVNIAGTGYTLATGNQGVATTDTPSFVGLTGPANIIFSTSTALPAWSGGVELNNESGYGFHVRGFNVQFDTGAGTGSPVHPTYVGAFKIGSDGATTIAGNLTLTMANDAGVLLFANGTQSATNRWMRLGWDATNHRFVINDYDSGTDRLRIDGSGNVTIVSGNVGIGLSPSYKLDVNGDANIASGSHFKINGTNLAGGDIGGTTVGVNLFTLINPGATTFIKLNSDNTVTARAANDFRTDIGLGSIATKAETVSTSTPSGTPADGDLWLQYTS